MIDKIKMLKEEFLNRGNLYDFEATVDKLISRVTSPPGCNLSCSYIDENSNIKFLDSGPWIQIGFKNRNGEKIEIIWDILHEYGHYLSGKPPLNNGPDPAREIDAWENALIEIKNYYTELIPFLEDFEKYKAKCLMSYGVQIK